MDQLMVGIERMRAAEGEQFLYVVLSAQKRYSIDHNDTYADNLADLDVDFNLTPSNFKPLTDADINTTNPLAKIIRQDDSYTLFILSTGTVTCNCNGSSCQMCQKLGYSIQ